MKLSVLLFAAALLVAGCGGGEEGAGSTVTVTSTIPPAETTEIRVYFLHNGKVWPVQRGAVGVAVAAQALQELSRGPTEQEMRTLASRRCSRRALHSRL